MTILKKLTIKINMEWKSMVSNQSLLLKKSKMSVKDLALQKGGVSDEKI